MKIKQSNTKGITPLMTTILLISLAVAVGVVVMNFGRATAQEEAECSVDPQLQLSNISGQMQICPHRSRRGRNAHPVEIRHDGKRERESQQRESGAGRRHVRSIRACGNVSRS